MSADIKFGLFACPDIIVDDLPRVLLSVGPTVEVDAMLCRNHGMLLPVGKRPASTVHLAVHEVHGLPERSLDEALRHPSQVCLELSC